MALKIFISSILFISIIAYFMPIDNLEKMKITEDTPQVIFEQSTMYTMDEKSVSKVVVSNSAVRYKNRDEMYDADIILRNQDPKKDFISESIKAEKIIKQGETYTLIKEVEYERDDFVKINTDYLVYDNIKGIATNEHPFKSIYKTHIYDGTNLYLDVNNDNIKSKNVHFEIDLKKEDKGKK